MRCPIDKKTIFAYLDNRLSNRQRLKTEAHLGECRRCRDAVARIRNLTLAAREAAEVPEPDWRQMDLKMMSTIADMSRAPRRYPLRRLATAAVVLFVFAASGVLAVTFWGEEASQQRPVIDGDSHHVGQTDSSGEDGASSSDAEILDSGLATWLETPFGAGDSPRQLDVETSGDTADSSPTSASALTDLEGDGRRAGERSIEIDQLRERSAKRWTGRLPVTLIQETLKRKIPGIKQCFERALRRNSKLILYLDVELIIDETGTVKRVTTQGIDTPSEMKRCVEHHLKASKFPPPKGGPMKVVMPLRLYPES